MSSEPPIAVADHPSAAALLEAAGTWLEEQEARNDRLLGLCHDQPDDVSAPGLWLSARAEGSLVGALAYVPGTDARLAAETTETAALALATAAGRRHLRMKLVTGPPPAVEAFARLLRGSPTVFMETRVHTLCDAPADPPAGCAVAAGALAAAAPEDHELLLPWYLAFSTEASGVAPDESRARARLSLDIARARVFHWKLPDGTSSCLVGLGEPTRHNARIALVYTPPALRGRGFASAAVRELSRRCLSGPDARRCCTLHTDVRNKRAERIYQRIGYRFVGDSRTYSLDA